MKKKFFSLYLKIYEIKDKYNLYIVKLNFQKKMDFVFQIKLRIDEEFKIKINDIFVLILIRQKNEDSTNEIKYIKPLLKIKNENPISYFINFNGIFKESLQYLNISIILVTLLVFHLEILGNDDNDEQLQNISLIFLTLLVFHLEISGNDNNDEQS